MSDTASVVTPETEPESNPTLTLLRRRGDGIRSLPCWGGVEEVSIVADSESQPEATPTPEPEVTTGTVVETPETSP